MVRKAKSPKKNLSKEETTTIKSLCSNKNIVILPADKRNVTVVMNTSNYEIKMESLLTDPSYKKITNDVTTRLEKITGNKIKAALIDSDSQTN
ncbi:hypothetical protein Trydic_g7324 [Trypoxylus dichotomus]